MNFTQEELSHIKEVTANWDSHTTHIQAIKDVAKLTALRDDAQARLDSATIHLKQITERDIFMEELHHKLNTLIEKEIA